MAMSEMEKWQKSIERAKISNSKAKQRRRDIQDLKDAGVWVDPRERYLVDGKYIKPDAPVWFRNLYKAWGVQKEINNDLHQQRAFEPTLKRKRVVNRFKCSTKRIKRSEQMQQLLGEHGIYVGENNMLSDEFSEWRFCPNGRLQIADEPTISVILFLDRYAET